MVVIKFSDKVEVLLDNIDAPLCGRIYKEEDGYLVPWSGTDPDTKTNCFTWPKEDNDWIPQKKIITKISRTSKDISIMVNSAHRPPKRIEIHRIHAPSV